MGRFRARIWGWTWRLLAGVVIGLLLLPTLVPPFLDRLYYRGPISTHYDGERFFNPEGETQAQAARRSPLDVALRLATMKDQATWPDRVAVHQGRPARMPDPPRMVATWIGHSTVLVQAGGLNILTDPIYSDHAGPWGRIGPRRVRDPGIALDALPRIDLVLVSHDHWDHLDLPTLRRLWDRDRPLIVTSLGNDTILKGVGISSVAGDWGQNIAVRPGVTVTIEQVHHWGSRWMRDRNRALWSGFSVTLPGGNLFFAGDTGWGDGRWIAEAARHGPYRLALIPIGAYLPRDVMHGNHIDPVEAVDLFGKLGAGHALAVHWGTFKLSAEGVDDPPRLLAATLAQRRIDPGRFRALEVGQNWDVPPLP